MHIYGRQSNGVAVPLSPDDAAELIAEADATGKGVESINHFNKVEAIVDYIGSAVPNNTVGIDGTYYFCTSNLNVYLKTAGVWNVSYNIGTVAVPVFEDFTGDDTLGADETGKYITNNGAGGDVNITLPQAVRGLIFHAQVLTPQYLRLTAQNISSSTDRICNGSAYTSAPGGYIRSNDIQANLTLMCMLDGQWNVFHQEKGTWTIDS